MSPTAATVTKVVRPEDKEQLLADFIQTSLAAALSPTVRIVLIAHSPASPVVRALASVAHADPARAMELRVIFASLELAGPAADLEAADIVGMRLLSDPRLHDAHEQIVIESGRTWIGDCLRRDPSRRDAYETFALSDARLACRAERSFERLWKRAAPQAEATRDHTEACPAVAGVVPTPADQTSTALASTRH